MCGTSWQSNLELEALRLAKKLNKRVVSFIDHWVNYRERFWDGDRYCLPDEIWVGDRDALQIAKNIFPRSSILLQENPYFLDLQKEIEGFAQSKIAHSSSSILYVCEPIREHAFLSYGNEYHWGYTEEEAISFFLENTNYIDANIKKVVVRPHPSEKQDKYDWVKGNNSHIIEIGGKETLLQEIINADIVVGCESMAMVVALLAGKRVISSIPSSGKKCSLPQENIEHMRDLINRSPNS
jgi:hypothetical protein